VEKSKDLQDKWDASRKEEFDSNFSEGTLIEITEEQARSMFELPIVWVFKTKRDGRMKTRLTLDGSKEDNSTFQPNSTYAPTLPVESLMYLIAYGTYHNMRMQAIDWVRAFPRHNDMTHSAYVNQRELCVHFSPWESGRPGGMWAKVTKVTQGLRDAPRVFVDISDELLMQTVHVHRSQALGMSQLFYRHGDNLETLMVLGKNVDDLFCITTRGAAGDALFDELLGVCNKQGWDFTRQEVGVGEVPFVIHSMTIQPVVMQGDQAVLVTQPGQLEAIQKAFFGSYVDLDTLPETMLPPTWTPLASAADPQRVDALTYMRLMGTVAWAGHTLAHSGAISLLQSQGGRIGGPSSLDMDALHWLAGYILRAGKEGAGRMFYRGPPGSSTINPPQLHVYADSGLPGHVNGAAQDGRALFLGTPNELNAAFLIKSNKNTGRQSDSVPGDEVRAAVSAAKDCIQFAQIGMELAGRMPRTDHGDMQNSAPPVVHAGATLGTIWDQADADEDALNANVQWLLASEHCPPSVDVYEDSQAVVQSVLANNRFKGVTKMRHDALPFQVLVDWHNRHLIQVKKCSTMEQKADALTGVMTGPVATTRSAIDLYGWQPALQGRFQRQTQRFRRANPTEPMRGLLQQEDLPDMVVEDEYEESYAGAARSTWSDAFPRFVNPIIEGMLETLGVRPGCGLGKHGTGRVVALDGFALSSQGRKGIGLGRAAYDQLAQSATMTSTAHQQSISTNLPDQMRSSFVPASVESGSHFASVTGTVAEVEMIPAVQQRRMEKDSDMVLAELTLANTLANQSQPAGDGQLSMGLAQGGITVSEEVEDQIANSSILDWVAGKAYDRKELEYVRETQLAALQQRGKLAAQQNLSARSSDDMQLEERVDQGTQDRQTIVRHMHSGGASLGRGGGVRFMEGSSAGSAGQGDMGISTSAPQMGRFDSTKPSSQRSEKEKARRIKAKQTRRLST